MVQQIQRKWTNAANFKIYLKNINKGPLFNNESTVLTLPVTNTEVKTIYAAINNKDEWVEIYGRAILKVDEIKRIVRVYEDVM